MIKVSSQSSCSTSDCRSHDEAKDLVFCKMSKLLNLIDSNRDLSYAFTDFKAKGKGETSKFMFVITKKSSSNSTDSKVKRTTYIRCGKL